MILPNIAWTCVGTNGGVCPASGSGKISGYGPLIKTNSGTLTILATNDYAGQTVIGGGVLSISSLPNATVASPVGIVEEDIDNLFFTGGTLRYTGGSGSTDRKLTVGEQGGTLEITNAGAVLTLNSGIAGGANIVLIPEKPFDIEKVCAYVEERFKKQYAPIVVVSEGAVPVDGGEAVAGEGELDDLQVQLPVRRPGRVHAADKDLLYLLPHHPPHRVEIVDAFPDLVAHRVEHRHPRPRRE